MATEGTPVTEDEALQFHAHGKAGKIEITPTKPLTTQRDLSLAYSPGVAWPCLHIARNPATAYDYTSKGNLVAVISNGTAVLGLGDLGALASKPVMEGKSVLFKRFADVDSIDLEVDTKNVDEFVNCVRFLGPSFGGINLEDIKAPECFIIEQRLRELLDIPVFHDDQHGTAIVAAAGLLNALDLTGRDIRSVKMVINGAGAASIACAELIKAMGVPHANVVLCDTKGVIWQGRTDGMNQWKSAHAVPTKARSLREAMEGADVFFGLSAKDAVDQDMVRAMAGKPIIFAMANPDPEITPEQAKAARPDAIVATGRSDYPNQVNNVLGFPYIFRGALDVRASTINDAMKIAAVEALAKLAREDVPDELDAAYSGRRLRYGADYIIPVPFDPRLISVVPAAVAEAAMKTGVARKPIADMKSYRRALSKRRDPTAAMLDLIFEQLRSSPPRRVVFAEGEEERVIRAAAQFQAAGYGTAVLVGRADRIAATVRAVGIAGAERLEIQNARVSGRNKEYTDLLYVRLQRQGYLWRDCQRLVNQDRNVFGALMVALGDADAIVTGTTRAYHQALADIRLALPGEPGRRVMGLTIVVTGGHTVFMADTTVNELPGAEEMADIAIEAAAKARAMGHVPRVALLSYSNFGKPMREKMLPVREAVMALDAREVDFEYEGDISAEVALDGALMRNLYPFSRLSGPANVLVMPGLHSANISSQLLQKLGGGTVIGPLLIGMSKPAQIVPAGATVAEIVNMAALAAAEVRR
ncbi:MAG: NADP-dependent malic enzyme [Rhodospirillales bacterium]|jgi:malate dehydrogenase (oxaloacetate-decarboxylating)(NADP+)